MAYTKPTTPAEKAAAREACAARADQLRTQIDAHLTQLCTRLDGGLSDTFHAWLRTATLFHTYSLNNQLLIMMQAPDARRVAGLRAWAGAGRRVKKGAKAVQILRPCTVPDPEAAPDASGRQPVKLVGFTYTNVFADTDTEGAPLTEFMTVHGDGAARALFGAVAARCPLPVVWERCPQDTHGYTDGARLVLDRVRCEAEPGSALRVLFHEWTHAALHFSAPGQRRADAPDRCTRELEADAAAYALCAHFGVDAAQPVADYVQLYRGNAEKLRASMTRIQSAVSGILTCLEDLEGAAQAA